MDYFDNNGKTTKIVFPRSKVDSDFLNNKKTFLSKLDKYKKGSLDQRVLNLIQVINSKPDYYTTSSCSGRVYLWTGKGKKNEMIWLRTSHDLIEESFFKIEHKGLIWLRMEDFILHICCRNLDVSNRLLEKARKIYKKSCILSASNKIIVEIRGSEFVEMPLYQDRILLFNQSFSWLKKEVNSRFKSIWKKEVQFKKLF
jgi:tRNA wybutosine-synthesizing protein 3